MKTAVIGLAPRHTHGLRGALPAGSPFSSSDIETLRRVLERTLDVKVSDGMDLASAARAEACLGAGLSRRSFDYLLISENVSACFVLNQTASRNAGMNPFSAAQRLSTNHRPLDAGVSVSISALAQELAAIGVDMEEGGLSTLSKEGKAIVERWAQRLADTLVFSLSAAVWRSAPRPLFWAGFLRAWMKFVPGIKPATGHCTCARSIAALRPAQCLRSRCGRNWCGTLTFQDPFFMCLG